MPVNLAVQLFVLTHKNPEKLFIADFGEVHVFLGYGLDCAAESSIALV